MSPDYKQIYIDIIREKYPEKINDLQIKNRLERVSSAIDIITLNKLIFGDAEYETEREGQKLRSYDEEAILEILDYQKKNKLNNTQVANHFKTSRNTIAKWKNIFKL